MVRRVFTTTLGSLAHCPLSLIVPLQGNSERRTQTWTKTRRARRSRPCHTRAASRAEGRRPVRASELFTRTFSRRRHHSIILPWMWPGPQRAVTWHHLPGPSRSALAKKSTDCVTKVGCALTVSQHWWWLIGDDMILFCDVSRRPESCL